jgi:hypothetical protein
MKMRTLTIMAVNRIATKMMTGMRKGVLGLLGYFAVSYPTADGIPTGVPQT